MTRFEQALRGYVQDQKAWTAIISEDTIRDRFITFLRDAFPTLRELRQITLEKYISGIAVRGRADALIGDVVVEFKRQLDSEGKKRAAAEQLDRYLNATGKLYGIITDGRRLIARGKYGDRFENISEIIIHENANPYDIQLWLDTFLFVQEKQIPTADDIVRRYGIHSPTYIKSMHLLSELWRELSTDSNIHTKYVEWESLMGIVYGSSPSQAEKLFLKHTYLSTFARVLAFVTLENKPILSSDAELLLSGKAFEYREYTNLVEEDFFSWLPHDDHRVREWIAALSEGLYEVYDLSCITEDLLKELYQELVGPDMRHDTGEYYTPDWVVEQVLREAGFPPASQNPEDASLLDPACGSGSFLFMAIRLLHEAGWSAEKIETFVNHHLRGMDINPLAVTIARINIVLALKPIFKDKKPQKPITLPVYLANALLAKSPDDNNDNKPILFDIPVESIQKIKARDDNKPIFFDIPVESIQKIKGREAPYVKSFQLPPFHNPDEYNDLLRGLKHYAELGYKTGDKVSEGEVRKGYENYLAAKGVSEKHRSWWMQNLRLLRWLMSDPQTDTIWIFLLRNALMPTYCAAKPYAFVVGNPPWIAYRSLQTITYQKLVLRLFSEYELIPQKYYRQVITSMEIADLFFAISANLYVREGGVVAFVMPRSVLTGAKQHAAFQEKYISKCFRILDYENVKPLFTVSTCALLWRKVETEPHTVPTKIFSGKLPTRNMPWKEAQGFLKVDTGEWTYKHIDIDKPLSPYHGCMKMGATIVPRSFWFIRPIPGGHYETDERADRMAKKRWKGIKIRGRVEEQFLYATLLSDDLMPFGYRKLSLIVLPLIEGRLLDARQASEMGYMGLAEWMRKAEQEWEGRKKGIDSLIDYINWQKGVTAQSPKAKYRLLYNTSGALLSSMVIEANDGIVLGDVKANGFVAECKTYAYETQNANEAHFLCALLNTALVNKAIESHKSERDIHRVPFEVLPIPLYDPQNADHRRLAELSMIAHERVRMFLEGAGDRKNIAAGRLRQIIRTEVIADLLREIDSIAGRVLGIR